MAKIFEPIYNGFWNEAFWLPPNISWKDVSPGASDGIHYREIKHLFYIPVPIAFVLLGLRLYLYKYCFGPLGIYVGIKNNKPKKLPPNPILEKSYSFKRKVNYKQIQGLTKQLDWTQRDVEQWLRLRRRQDKPTTLVKFCESAWRCLWYFSSFTYGTIMLWDKSWFWNFDECWSSYPHHAMTTGIWWYFMVNAGYYLLVSVTQFFDVKRKDFWEMLIHHIITIAALVIAWITNFHRTSAITLVIHDFSDIFLETAKMARYAGYLKFCNNMFGLFMVSWIITRLGVYAWFVCSATLGFAVIPFFPAYSILYGIATLIFLLNIFWSYLIFKLAYRVVTFEEQQDDIRSDSSDNEDSELNKG